MKIWTCKIGECEHDALPDGADLPMRVAVAKAYHEITGQESTFLFSGWGAELTEPERAVVENRLPSAEHEAAWHQNRSGEADQRDPEDGPSTEIAPPPGHRCNATKTIEYAITMLEVHGGNPKVIEYLRAGLDQHDSTPSPPDIHRR